MEIKIETCRQIPGKVWVQDALERLWHMLRCAIIFIASCREAQARRRIQLYLDDRVIDEFAKAGKRIAEKKVKN